MPSNHLILCRPLLLLPSLFASIRSFLMNQFFTSGGQNIGASASASVLLMNIQDWFYLSLFFFSFEKKKKSIYLAALGLSCLMWVLVPWPGIEPRVTAMEAWSLNHWTTREAPVKLYLVWCSLSKAKEGRYSSMTVFIYYYLPMINLENKVAKWQPKHFYILDSFTQVWNIWPVVNYPRFDWKLSCRKL